MQPTGIYSKLIVWTRRRRGPWKRRELDAAFGIKPGLAHYYLKQLEYDGHVERHGFATDDGRPLYRTRRAK